ncbi:MAG: SPFH domain-containing protein, partial [Nitrososphaerales archaeon]
MLPPLAGVDVAQVTYAVIGAFVVIVILALIASTIKIVREYERLVLFTLGRLIGARGPGIVFVVPFINKVNKVDLRERFLEVPHQ